MRIDPRTVMLVLTLILAVFGLAHLLFYLVRRRDHWFAYWSAANFAGMAAALLFVLRGGIPALLSIPTANTLAVLAWGGGWNGCLGFVGRRLRLADLGLLAVTVFLLMAIPSPMRSPPASPRWLRPKRSVKLMPGDRQNYCGKAISRLALAALAM